MEVALSIDDGPYSWEAGFSWETLGFAFQLTVRVQIQASSSIHKRQVLAIQKTSQREFLRYFDQRFVFHFGEDQALPVLARLHFTENQPHLITTLHLGHGQTELTNWYVGEKEIHLAHELGHQLGLLDEYRDIHSPTRNDVKSDGIFRDHSLMGNYQEESIKKADIKLRHGQRIASLISQSSGIPYKARMNRKYQVREGDGLGWIASRIYGEESEWRILYNANRDKIPSRDQLRPGTFLSLP